MAKKSRQTAVAAHPEHLSSPIDDEPINALESPGSSSSSSSEGSSDEEPARLGLEDGQSESSDDSSDDEAEVPAPASSPSKKRKRTELEPLPIPEDEDAPALSHAEKRRQKKKGGKDATTDASTTAASAKEEATHPGVAARTPRQHSVWVGNLSFKTTEADLRTFFAAAGEVTRVNLPLKPVPAGQPAAKWKSTRENRGFAYVDFSSKDAKVIAITMSEGHLEGRKLLIKDGDDFAGRPAEHASADRPEGTTNTKFAKRVLGTQKQPPAPTLFLGNLSFETTEASIRQMFDAHRRPTKEKGKDEAAAAVAGETKQAGEIKATKEDWIRKIRLGTFEDSGLCKGWAFVDFATIAAATAALTNPHNYALDGRELKVEYASAEAVRRGAAKGSAAGTKPKERKELGKPLGKGKYDRETRIAAKVAKQTGEVMPQEDPVERPAKRQKADDQEEDVYRGGKEDKRKVTDSRIGRPAQEKAKGQEMRRGKDGRMRPAPGAALAMAKRESTSIVPSQGTKIKF